MIGKKVAAEREEGVGRRKEEGGRESYKNQCDGMAKLGRVPFILAWPASAVDSARRCSRCKCSSARCSSAVGFCGRYVRRGSG